MLLWLYIQQHNNKRDKDLSYTKINPKMQWNWQEPKQHTYCYYNKQFLTLWDIVIKSIKH